jgi:ABC-type nitrate/sulfonate/bicarbonate transport system substrate-binding protein
VTPTTALWPLSPEKVLGLRAEWAPRYPKQLAGLLRAVYRAAAWTERPENHAEVAKLLAAPGYVGVSAELLHRALTGRLALRPGADSTSLHNFFVPSSHMATFPWVSHASWIYEQMVRWRQVESLPEYAAAARATYRPDLYRAALAQLDADIPRTDLKSERFFDGHTFNPVRARE